MGREPVPAYRRPVDEVLSRRRDGHHGRLKRRRSDGPRREETIEKLLPRRCVRPRGACDDAVEIEQKGIESGQVDDDAARRFPHGAGRRRMRQIGQSCASHCAAGLAAAEAPVVIRPWGIVLHPAVGAVLMSCSTIIVAINAQLLRRVRV